MQRVQRPPAGQSQQGSISSTHWRTKGERHQLHLGGAGLYGLGGTPPESGGQRWPAHEVAANLTRGGERVKRGDCESAISAAGTRWANEPREVGQGTARRGRQCGINDWPLRPESFPSASRCCVWDRLGRRRRLCIHSSLLFHSCTEPSLLSRSLAQPWAEFNTTLCAQAILPPSSLATLLCNTCPCFIESNGCTAPIIGIHLK